MYLLPVHDLSRETYENEHTTNEIVPRAICPTFTMYHPLGRAPAKCLNSTKKRNKKREV